MKRNKIIGPLATFAVLIIIHLMGQADLFNYTLAPAFVALAFAVYRGGTGPGLASAGLITAYGWWLLMPWQPWHFAVVAASAVAIALIIGSLQRRARLIDSINGNLVRVDNVRREINRLLDDWYKLGDTPKYQALLWCEDQLATLETLIVGWRQIAGERERATRDDERRD